MKQLSFIFGLLSIINIFPLQAQDTNHITNSQIYIEEELSPLEKQEYRLSSLESLVEKMERLHISGYMQAQWQYAEQNGIDGFQSGGKFGHSNNRFNIRRGRLKFSYQAKIAQMVIQSDFSEKGVSIRDAYFNLSIPSKLLAVQVGLFDRPFGYEISYSSSIRESAERSRVYLSLFPGEREVGAMVIAKGPSGWSKNFTLNIGIFNGNGVGLETDSRKDFIGRLAYLKKMNDSQFGFAFSYYNGGVLNNVDTNYSCKKNQGFQANGNQKNNYSKREYFGLSTQYIQQWALGTTHIRAEYIFGSQAGIFKQNNMPGGTSFAINNPSENLYNRKFNGYYIMLVQDLGTTKHTIVLKYDAYDPNTLIKGNEIGSLNKTSAADIAYSTFGLGYIYRLNQTIRLMAYYDIISNETSDKLVSSNPLNDFSNRIKQNVFTLRAQIKF